MHKRMMFIVISVLFLAVLVGCNGTSPTPPALTVDPDGPIDFGADVEQLFLAIDNAGQQTLRWSVTVSDGEDWLTVSPTEGVNRGTVALNVDRAGLPPDTTYTAELTIASNGGEAHRTVTMSVPPEEIGPPLDEVRDLSVTGFTVPTGMFGSDGVGATEWNGAVNGSGASMLYELARQLDSRTVGIVSTAAAGRRAGSDSAPLPGAGIAPDNVPPGYEAGFVLSWQPVAEAEGYRIFAGDGDEDPTLVAEPSAAELEYGGDGHAIYVVAGDFAVGEQRTYTVQAFAAGREDGPESEPDTGVIIAPARLVSPSDGEAVSAQPLFVWEEHPDGMAYGVYVATGSIQNHMWHVVVGGGVTDIRYPGDDPHALPALSPGDYLWYITARGPVINGKTGGMAVGVARSFVVEDGN